MSSTLKKSIAMMGMVGAMIFASHSALAATVVDAAGRHVEIPKKVDRILLGEGRLFSAISLLEGQKPFARIAGWQGDFRKLDPMTYAQYKEKFPEIDNIPLIGNTSEDSISPEKVLTIHPDIAVFGLAGHGPGKNNPIVKQLEKAGIPVVFVDFRANPLKNTVPSMRALGKVLHREKQAEEYIAFYQKNMKLVTDITSKMAEKNKPTVFLELRPTIGGDCCGTAGNGNMGDFIDLAGGKNIAKPLLPAPLGQLNLETVISTNPDIYMISGAKKPNNGGPAGLELGAQVSETTARNSMNALLERKGINTLDAVKQDKVYGIWHHYYNSPYNVLVVQAFAKWFYPEKFANLDPNKTMKEMYSKFLAVKPTGTYWVAHKK